MTAKHLLDNKLFFLCSGSCIAYAESTETRKHHYGYGGLARHTHEVITIAMDVCHRFPQYQIDEIELFLAALFHDAGKMYDYKEEKSKENWGGMQWVKTPHKRTIHHISRSGIVWHDAVSKLGNSIDAAEFYAKYHDPVLHAILSHHGTREWGSPVAPKSRVAWLVHLCDGISARMNDADTLDVVRDRKT